MKPPRPFQTLASLLLLAASARAEVLERVIVKVNGDIVTQSEFESRQVAAIQAARVPATQIEAYLRQNNARILQEAIDELLIVQRADDLGVKIRPEYTSDVIDNIKKENNITSDEALRDQLRREGLTLDDMRRNIERSILRRQVVAREVESKVVLSEADLHAEYEKRKAELTHPAEAHLQEIVVSSESLALAQELVARARGGEDFATLARENSKAPSRSQDGDLGTLVLGDLHAEIRNTAESLPPGAISEPIASPDGWRILRVVERTEEGVTSYESAKPELRKRLGDERMNDEYERYVKGLREKALIDVRVREVPLSVSVPVTTSILEPPEPEKEAAPAAPGAATANESEFVTTPQSAPERVAPGATDAPKQPAEKEPEKPPSP